MEIYADESTFAVEQKDDDSPLTAADRAANDLICAGLAELTPEIPIISEENNRLPYSERQNWHRCWLVDPLDGTKEFLKRNGDFTVNIALIEDGRPVLGIVQTPVTGHVAWAAQGLGAWERHAMHEADSPLSVARFSWADKGLRFVCSRTHLNPETEAYLARFDAPETISRGSSLKFLLIARGEAHVYPRLGPTSEWDTAAAQAIVEAAGGKVLGHETGRPLRYNKENLLNPWFIVQGASNSEY